MDELRQVLEGTQQCGLTPKDLGLIVRDMGVLGAAAGALNTLITRDGKDRLKWFDPRYLTEIVMMYSVAEPFVQNTNTALEIGEQALIAILGTALIEGSIKLGRRGIKGVFSLGYNRVHGSTQYEQG